MASFHKIIFKNTGLFGLSQLIGISARLVTNKVVAIVIGPAGIGLIGLIDNILKLIYSFTNFGIASSSVREIALIDNLEVNELHRSQRLIKIIYRLALLVGLLGVIVLVVFSKHISNIVFETESKYLWIIALSSYLLFNSISSMRLAVLQAKKKVKKIVIYNIVSSIVSSTIAIFLEDVFLNILKHLISEGSHRLIHYAQTTNK